MPVGRVARQTRNLQSQHNTGPAHAHFGDELLKTLPVYSGSARLPGTRTFLAGEEQGVVYASLEDFNGAVIDLLGDAERRTALGERAYEAAKSYDWRSIAETMASWLEEAAS